MGAKIDCWDIDADLIERRLVARTVANERRPMEIGGGLGNNTNFYSYHGTGSLCKLQVVQIHCRETLSGW
jgi:hypothetical protein